MKKIILILFLLPVIAIGQTTTEWTNRCGSQGQNILTFKSTLATSDVGKYVKCYVDDIEVKLSVINDNGLFVDTLDLTGNNVIRIETVTPFKSGKTFDKYSIQVTPYNKPLKDTIK